MLATGLGLIAGCVVLCFCRPAIDRTGNALRPQHGEAETALAEITTEMGLPPEPLWLIVSGTQETEVYRRLAFAEEALNGAMSNRVIGRYLLPTAMWPRAEYQAANRSTAAALAAECPLLREAAFGEGFNTNALILTDELVRTWARAGGSTDVVWPTNHVSQWLLKRFVAHTPDQWLVMGLVYPATNQVADASLAELSTRLARNEAYLSGWQLLGATTFKRVKSKMWQVVAPMVILVLASLGFAFRRATEILLGLAVLFLSGLVLLTVMAAAGWTWNLLNMMAVPLILGTGVDYSIFMQLALRRHGGDLVLVRRSIGRALLLCGGTAIAGFSSLAWSSNPGMASLGKVCAVGIGANMIIAVFLLPVWWIWARKSAATRSARVFQCQTAGSGLPAGQAGDPAYKTGDLIAEGRVPSYGAVEAVQSAYEFSSAASPSTPSSFYRAGLWHFGLAVVRILPVGLVKGFCLIVAEIYYRVQRERREMVVENFLPVLGGDHAAARKAAHGLFRKFSAKLVDLWRVESGVPVNEWLTNAPELDIIHAARDRGRGVLFITLHLGNWEHGGLLLNQLGIQLTVLTLAEPDDGLTELRIALRRRCGVETLIIGQDSFAFVEVIKRLQAGEALAISIDRPAARGGVVIEFFGRMFDAPVAAAELARASGCALIGVTLVRRPNGYLVKVLPEFAYDRRELGRREARQELTQKILRAFEPEIRKDVDQWYQFVPLWRKDK
jgi:lauroyl/myristoyl acyltransferase